MTVFQPQMFQEESTELPEDVLYYFRRSLHSVQDSECRWSERRERGLTDDELREAISCEFGIYGGCGSPRIRGWGEHKGGANPMFRWYVHGEADEVVLKGKALIDMVRRVLEIPEPY